MERLIGWVYSRKLKRGLLSGYGIYLTDSRILGSKKRPRLISEGRIAYRVTSPSELWALLKEVEATKDMEVRKDEIRAIEMRRPSVLGFGGELTIRTYSKSYRLKVKSRAEFDNLRGLFARFCREKLKLFD